MLKRSSSARRLTAAEVATSVHRQSGHQSFCASKEAVLRSKGTAVSRPTGARLLDVIRGDSFLTALGPACSREPRLSFYPHSPHIVEVTNGRSRFPQCGHCMRVGKHYWQPPVRSGQFLFVRALAISRTRTADPQGSLSKLRI